MPLKKHKINSNLVSIIIPIYNNAESLSGTYDEIKKVMKQKKYKHEIIFVDDGSSDESFSVIKSIALRDAEVVAIKFVRNFGQHSATLAGIKQSKGDVIITIDADLQNDPHDIPRLIEKMQEGYQVVSGCRNLINVPLMKRLRSQIINWCIYSITGVKLNDSTSTFKAYRRDIIDDALKIEHYMKFLPVYVCWMGSKITEIDANYRARKSGKSQYNLLKLIILFIEWLLLFSSGIKTVILLMLIGVCFIMLGVLFLSIYLISFLALTKPAGGILLMFAIFSLFGGINFIVLGIISERVKQLQTTVNKQPHYIIDLFASIKNGKIEPVKTKLSPAKPQPKNSSKKKVLLKNRIK